jgi:hypothetical protein
MTTPGTNIRDRYRPPNQATRTGMRRAGCRGDLKMRALVVAMVAAFVLIAGGTVAAAPPRQDIGGTWQGTLSVGQQTVRVVFQITKAADGTLTATMYSIDQRPTCCER